MLKNKKAALTTLDQIGTSAQTQRQVSSYYYYQTRSRKTAVTAYEKHMAVVSWVLSFLMAKIGSMLCQLFFNGGKKNPRTFFSILILENNGLPGWDKSDWKIAHDKHHTRIHDVVRKQCLVHASFRHYKKLNTSTFKKRKCCFFKPLRRGVYDIKVPKEPTSATCSSRRCLFCLGPTI